MLCRSFFAGFVIGTRAVGQVAGKSCQVEGAYIAMSEMNGPCRLQLGHSLIDFSEIVTLKSSAPS
jgi:hypothetical protein